MNQQLTDLIERLATNPYGWDWKPGGEADDDSRYIDGSMVDTEMDYCTIDVSNEEGERVCLNMTFWELQDLHDAIGVALAAARLTGKIS